MADPVSAIAIIGTIVTAGAAVGGAISSHRQGQEQLDIQEETMGAEEEYRQEQRKLQISELKTEIAALQEQVGSVGTQALWEYGRIGQEALGVYSAQRGLSAFAGADIGAGSPLAVMTGTLRQAQEDLAYKRAYYAAELTRIQGQITGLEEQLGILQGGVAEPEKETPVSPLLPVSQSLLGPAPTPAVPILGPPMPGTTTTIPILGPPKPDRFTTSPTMGGRPGALTSQRRRRPTGFF